MQIDGLFGLYDDTTATALSRFAGLQLTVGDPLSAVPALTAQPFDPAISYLGGHPAYLGSTYPRYLFAGSFNLTLLDGSTGGIGGTVAFRTDATDFDVLTYSAGYPSDFRIFVDGSIVDGDALSLPSDGSLRFVHVDLSRLGLAAGPHTVELVYPGAGAFGGLALPPGASLAPIEQAGPRIVFLGDSFTEGTGASSVAEDYDSLTGRFLGSDDIWQSGFGGTGYLTPYNGRPSLDERIVADGVNAHADIYVIAMGLNDGNAPGLSAAVLDTLTKLTAGAPHAKIFVVADWNPAAPGGAIYPDAVAAIEAATEQFPGVVFLDPSGVGYAKFDPTHPNEAGHETLATWLTTQIRAAMGADGVLALDTPGDAVGPLAISGWDPAEQYHYQVLENGQPSARFEVVDSGDAFPILRLLPDQEVTAAGPMSVTVEITDAHGDTASQVISFTVRGHDPGPGPADFDGDGIADLLFANAGELASWQLGHDGAIVGGGTIGDPGANWSYAATGDFDGDGRTDILFRAADGTLASWKMDGTAIVGGGTIGDPGAAWTVLGTGDVNGDGRSDILFHNSATGEYASWDLDGTALIGGGAIGVAPGYAFVAATDLDGDGRTDLVFRNSSTGALAAWLLNDTAIVGGGTIGTPGGSWQVKGTGDFNGDGKADLLFEDAGGNYAIWEMDGTAVIGGGAIGNPGGTWQLAKVIDLDQDGRSDLLFVDAAGHYASWLMSGTAIVGGGAFAPGSGGFHVI